MLYTSVILTLYSFKRSALDNGYFRGTNGLPHVVFYHIGIPGRRVGLGSKRILKNVLMTRLMRTFRTVSVKDVYAVDDVEGDIGRSFELMRRVSCAVSETVEEGAFPVFLAGSCNTEVGATAGLASEDTELVWFDAHSDLDSAEETTSGYFDGMGVSMLIGESWKALTATIPGYRPLPLERIASCGVRDLSEAQMHKLKSSPARVVYGKSVVPNIEYAEALGEQLDKTTSTYRIVHIDLDCLDTSIGKANEYAAEAGLSANDLHSCIEAVVERCMPIGITIASFNPLLEDGDVIADVAIEAIEKLVRFRMARQIRDRDYPGSPWPTSFRAELSTRSRARVVPRNEITIYIYVPSTQPALFLRAPETCLDFSETTLSALPDGDGSSDTLTM